MTPSAKWVMDYLRAVESLGGHAPVETMERVTDYIEALEELWSMVSDMVEGGRLREADIPDDYQAIVSQMKKLVLLEDESS